MNAKQALKKAISIWGDSACVKDRGNPSLSESGVVMSDRFLVGRIAMGMFFSVEGDGPTWEAAFAKVEERRAKDKARYDAIRKPKVTRRRK